MPPLSLYAQLLGPAWDVLAEPVRRLHAGAPGPHRGTFAVTRGRGWLARVLAALLRLPAAGAAVPVTLELRAAGGVERWQRRFGACVVSTSQYGRGGELVERFGLIECRFCLEAREGALHFAQTGAAVTLGPLRLPLPRALWPRVVGVARPAGRAARVEVVVSIAAPVCGLLVDYRGEIAVEDSRA